ncbi:hypothetical protein EBS80_00930 [bacterium]|nr:hypothetical protein [bacterium]
MHRVNGSSRVAYVFPSVGIVVKVARVGNPFEHLALAVELLKRRGGRRAWEYVTTPMAALGLSPAFCLFGGLIANVREWWFSWTVGHPVLAPTYLTLAFVNVQRAATPLPHAVDKGWWVRLRRATGVPSVEELGDTHALSYGNFGLRNGRPCVVDYGSPDMCRLVRLYGDRLHDAIDLVSPP